MRTDEKVVGERGVVEKVEPSQNKRSILSKSVDKEELVRRAVAHATAAADSFPMDEEDDDDDDEADDVQDQPHIARDQKEELSGAAEQLAIEEAPIATAKCFRSVFPQQPIPVIESNKLVSPTVIGLNTAAQLESDAKARAAAVDRVIYGVRRYEGQMRMRSMRASSDKEKKRKKKEEEDVRVRSQADEQERASGFFRLGFNRSMRSRFRASPTRLTRNGRHSCPHSRPQ